MLSTKINNIAITIDKIKHCLQMMDTCDPPLRTLTYRETFDKYYESAHSFYWQLCFLFVALEGCENYKESRDIFIKEISQIRISDEMSEEEIKLIYFRVLELFRELSFRLRKIKTNVVFVDALADMIYLFSHTYTYSTATDSYKAFYGDEVAVRKCEISWDPKYRDKFKNVPRAFGEEQIVHKSKKEYNVAYVWGQLCY